MTFSLSVAHLSSGSSHKWGATSYTAASADSSAARSSLSATGPAIASRGGRSTRASDSAVSSSISSLGTDQTQMVSTAFCTWHMLQGCLRDHAAAGPPAPATPLSAPRSPPWQRKSGAVNFHCHFWTSPCYRAGRRIARRQFLDLLPAHGADQTLTQNRQPCVLHCNIVSYLRVHFLVHGQHTSRPSSFVLACCG